MDILDTAEMMKVDLSEEPYLKETIKNSLQ